MDEAQFEHKFTKYLRRTALKKAMPFLEEKLPYSLSALYTLFEFGKKKYPNRAWDKHENIEEAKAFVQSRLGSLKRHCDKALADPSSTDEESHADHLIAVAWNALVCAELLEMIYEEELFDKNVETGYN